MIGSFKNVGNLIRNLDLPEEFPCLPNKGNFTHRRTEERFFGGRG